MYFKRKAYNKLLEWKKLYSDKYAALLEGARRVGKSTIAESFAKNEYKSYIMIDFSKTTSNILDDKSLMSEGFRELKWICPLCFIIEKMHLAVFSQ